MKVNRGEIHGELLVSKPEGVARLLCESFDGMNPWKSRNEIIVQGRKFARKKEADMYCRSETRANWTKIGYDYQLKHIFASEMRLRAMPG